MYFNVLFNDEYTVHKTDRLKSDLLLADDTISIFVEADSYNDAISKAMPKVLDYLILKFCKTYKLALDKYEWKPGEAAYEPIPSDSIERDDFYRKKFNTVIPVLQEKLAEKDLVEKLIFLKHI